MKTIQRLLGVLAFAVTATLTAVAPAQAFQATQLADGGFEYFFAAPSLRIESPGDLDLGGLSFIEGVADGFRVGSTFALDWLGDENAWLAPAAASWTGFASAGRHLEIIAGGNLSFGTVSLFLAGGEVFLAGGSINLRQGSVINVASGDIAGGTPPISPRQPEIGGSGLIVILPGGDIAIGDRTDLIPPRQLEIGGGGSIAIQPGGGITLTATSPIPEPANHALLAIGLLAIAVVTRRGMMAR